MSTRFDTVMTDGSGAVSVSELLRQARKTLETRFPLMWIAGEVSGLTRAASGHLYFTLKDEDAQVRCVMYRSRAQLLRFRLSDGQRVEVRALVTLYEARGEFQLQAEDIREAGRGRLFEAFLKLKETLATEGLFDPARKRDLPELPRAIGIISSLHAAALHDVRIALRRRAPHVPVVLYPSPVQGEGAGARLAAMLRTAAARAVADEVDVLILCRGGGSLEDLWAFNDEALVRAIAASPVPVVSGVGHETDFTLCDFVADLRAATPTAAAEIVSAGHYSAIRRLTGVGAELRRLMERRIEASWERIDRARGRLTHPRDNLRRQGERIRMLARRLSRASSGRQEQLRARLTLAASRLRSARPATDRQTQRLQRLGRELGNAAERSFAQRKRMLAALATHLQHLNPEAVLGRGYSIVRHADGSLLRDAGSAGTGEVLAIQPAQGRLVARVEAMPEQESHPGVESRRD